MSPGDVLELLAVALFIALNGFFVASEFALVKLRATYQEGAAGSKKRDSKDDLVAQAVARIDSYLSVTQLGITLASLGLGALGEPAIAHRLTAVISNFHPGPLPPTAHTVISGVAFALLTYAHVLLGELVPKLVAIQRSVQTARLSAWPLRIFYYMLYPGLWVLEASSRAILSRFGMAMDTHSEAALSEDEIVGILAAHVARGRGGEAKQAMVKRLLRFTSRTARQAMIPRVDVVYLPVNTSGAGALEQLRVTEYSRVPLSKGRELDEVVGYLYWKDLLRQASPAQLTTLEPLRRDARFVPESTPLIDVLHELQRTNTPFAVVVDEYGGTSGILTMEDLLEEIVGEIRDESDVELQRIERKGDGWEADGAVTLDEMAAAGLDFGDHDAQETLSSVVLARLGRIARPGDTVTSGSLRFEVVAMSRRRITRVRVTTVEPPEAE